MYSAALSPSHFGSYRYRTATKTKTKTATSFVCKTDCHQKRRRVIVEDSSSDESQDCSVTRAEARSRPGTKPDVLRSRQKEPGICGKLEDKRISKESDPSMASSTIASESPRLIRASTSLQEAAGLRLRLTRVDAKADTNGSRVGFGAKNNEPRTQLGRQWSVEEAWPRRREREGEARGDNFISTPSVNLTATSTSIENYKLTTPSHTDGVLRRRRRRNRKPDASLVGGSRKSLPPDPLTSLSSDGKTLSTLNKGKSEDSSSCDEGQPRLFIHFSDASPISPRARRGFDADDPLFVLSSNQSASSDEEEFEIPVGGIITIPKSKCNAFSYSIPAFDGPHS